MKIAVFHELSFGGARRAVYELSKRLNKKHTLDLYFVDEKNDKNIKDVFQKVFFYNFSPLPWNGHNWKVKLYKDTLELFRLYRLHKKIAADIQSKKYDLVFISPSKITQAPFILRFLSQPKVYFCHEPLRIIYDSSIIAYMDNLPLGKKFYGILNNWVRKTIDKINLNKADLILANSLFSKKWIFDAYGINAEVCYLGVDYHKFKPLKIKKKYDLLFFGRKDSVGGYNLLNNIVKLFKIKPKVKILSKDNPVEKERISDAKLIQEYNKSRIILMLGKNEPFTLIPLEAMACGIPVIAVKESCFMESVINGKTGFLVKRSAKALLSSIKYLLAEEQLRSDMGYKAREIILANWTWDKSAENLEKLFQKIIVN